MPHPATSRFHRFFSKRIRQPKPGQLKSVPCFLCFFWLFLLAGNAAWANVPGGGTNGANVTLTDNGSTVTIANGIVSILINKSGAATSPRSITPTTTAAARRR